MRDFARRIAEANGTREIRHLDERTSPHLRAKAKRNDSIVTIEGYSSVFDVWYDLRDGWGPFKERVDPKAFDKTLAEGRNVLATFNHDLNYPLGAHDSGTLRSSTDEIGLRYSVDLDTRSPNSQTVAIAVERGDVPGGSFMFEVIEDRWTFDRDTGEEYRTLLELRLFEHGPVMTPANEATTPPVPRSLDIPDEAIASLAIKIRRGVPLNYADVRALNSRRADVLDALRDAGLNPRRTDNTQPQDSDLEEIEAMAYQARLLKIRAA